MHMSDNEQAINKLQPYLLLRVTLELLLLLDDFVHLTYDF